MNQEKKQKLTVVGIEITEAQMTAAHQVMMGTWHKDDVERALIAAGVPKKSGKSFPRHFGPMYPVAMRAADRILQYERKAGRIAPIRDKRGYWGWVT